VLSLVLLRMEHEALEVEPVRLTEAFIADMDGQIRESGFGDLVVGKQVGGIMALLGGRLGAYRGGIDGPVLVRTLWRNDPPPPETVEATVDAVAQLQQRIDTMPIADLLAGRAG
jgi:cytochrome b pre-mRNA-processing protein 3